MLGQNCPNADSWSLACIEDLIFHKCSCNDSLWWAPNLQVKYYPRDSSRYSYIETLKASFTGKDLEMGIRDNLNFLLSLTELPKANPNSHAHKVKTSATLKSVSVTVTPLLTRLTPLKPSRSYILDCMEYPWLVLFQLFLELKNIFLSLLSFSLFGLISMRTHYYFKKLNGNAFKYLR